MQAGRDTIWMAYKGGHTRLYIGASIWPSQDTPLYDPAYIPTHIATLLGGHIGRLCLGLCLQDDP